MLTALQVFTAAGVFIDDWSMFTQSCIVRSGEHGFESLEATIQIPFYDAFNYYTNYGALKVRAIWGPLTIFEGRLNDPTQFVAGANGGLKIVAYGYWVAFSDLVGGYTALWSYSGTNALRKVTETDIASRTPGKYTIEISNHIQIATTKGATYTNGADVGSVVFMAPYGGSRQIIGISFDYVGFLPINWLFQYVRFQEGFTGAGGTTVVTGAGAAFNGSINITLTACNYIEFAIFNNTGANSTPAGETGVNYVRLTNIRIVTSTTNRINTSLTANRNAGVNVTATVVSTVNMYVGQRLTISGATSESVIVLSIGSPTQFNATFVNNYLVGNNVLAHVVYPDEIIKDCVSTIATLNPTQLSSSTRAIQSQGVDCVNAIYEDATIPDVINALVTTRGDTQTIPRQWVALIYERQELIVRPRGLGAVWYIDVDNLEVQRSLGQLYNSITATYNDAIGRKQRSTATDVSSVARYGVTRRKSVAADTTSSTEASIIRDTLLNAAKDPIPRVRFPIDAIYDASGVWHDPRELRADDTVTIRNFLPLVGAIYDKIRTLVVTRVEYDLISGKLGSVELEIPLPRIDVQIARALRRTI